MSVTTFIPELWNARLLANLEKVHVATRVVNRNYEGEIKQRGDTVHINSIGEVSIKDYTRNTDIDGAQELTTTDQTLVIDQAKYFNFQVDNIDKVQASGDLIDIAMQRASYGLSEVSDKFLLGLIASGVDASNKVGTTAAPIALTSSNIYEYICKLALKLNLQNVPSIGRSIILPPEAYNLLLQDKDHFAIANEAGTGNQTVVNGVVARAGGFDIYMSNNCVYTTGTTPYWTITAQIPEATTYAEQIIETVAYSPEKRFGDAVKGLHVYGGKVTNGKMISALYCSIA